MSHDSKWIETETTYHLPAEAVGPILRQAFREHPGGVVTFTPPPTAPILKVHRIIPFWHLPTCVIEDELSDLHKYHVADSGYMSDLERELVGRQFRSLAQLAKDENVCIVAVSGRKLL